jgi:hypothetical protein
MLVKTVLFVIVVLVALQFVPLHKTNPPVDEKLALHADAKVMKILQKSCYDCHSNQTHWSVYSKIAPFSFGVVSHVEDGRKALNFSEYAKIPQEIKVARLKRAISTVKLELMPLGSYTLFHPQATLNTQEKKTLIEFFTQELHKVNGDEK